MEPWKVCRSLVAESHHFYEKQDPDQTFHFFADLDPDPAPHQSDANLSPLVCRPSLRIK
jgi:hypothetical protein